MQLHDIGQPKQRAQRIGRGGKRGTTSGRGQKGQRSRAGHKIRPALRDLIQRLPKKRGFANKATSPEEYDLSVAAIAKRAAGEAEITVEVLQRLRLVPARHRGPVKVLANGSVSAPLHLKGIRTSEGARAKIEAAGGSVA